MGKTREIINVIKNNYSQAIWTGKVKEKGSGIIIDKNYRKNCAVLKGEKLRCYENEITCDFLIFIGNNFIKLFIVELKSKGPDIGKVEEQINCCCKFARKIVDEYNLTRYDIQLFPVLIFKSGIKGKELSKIKKMKFKVTEKYEKLMYKRCQGRSGIKLTDIEQTYHP